jgi:hypothetical protein
LDLSLPTNIFFLCLTFLEILLIINLWIDHCPLFQNLLNLNYESINSFLVLRHCIPNTLETDIDCDKMKTIIDANDILLSKSSSNSCRIEFSSFDNIVNNNKSSFLRSYLIKFFENLLKTVTTPDKSRVVRFKLWDLKLVLMDHRNIY